MGKDIKLKNEWFTFNSGKCYLLVIPKDEKYLKFWIDNLNIKISDKGVIGTINKKWEYNFCISNTIVRNSNNPNDDFKKCSGDKLINLINQFTNN